MRRSRRNQHATFKALRALAAARGAFTVDQTKVSIGGG